MMTLAHRNQVHSSGTRQLELLSSSAQVILPLMLPTLTRKSGEQTNKALNDITCFESRSVSLSQDHRSTGLCEFGFESFS